jgi:hypothetical protein
MVENLEPMLEVIAVDGGDVMVEEEEDMMLVLYPTSISRFARFGTNPVLLRYFDGVLARITLQGLSGFPSEEVMDELRKMPPRIYNKG